MPLFSKVVFIPNNFIINVYKTCPSKKLISKRKNRIPFLLKIFSPFPFHFILRSRYRYTFRAISFADIYSFESTSHVLGRSKSVSKGCSIPDRFECMLEQHSPSVQFAYISESSFSLHGGINPREVAAYRMKPFCKVNWHRVYEASVIVWIRIAGNWRSRISTTEIQLAPRSKNFFFLHSPPAKHFTPDNSFMIPAFILSLRPFSPSKR